MMYYLADNDCYVYLKKILKTERHYFLAEILWFDKSSKELVFQGLEEIPYSLYFSQWKIQDGTYNIPQ